MNPEGVITQAFAQAADAMQLGSGLLIMAIPIIFLIASLLGAYATGGKLGLVAIGLAFFGGMLLISQPLIGLALVGIGVLLGLLASPDREIA